jgi:hypothetical protein
MSRSAQQSEVMNIRTITISGIACGILTLALPMQAAKNSELPPVTTIRVPNSGIQPQILERGGIVHVLYFSGDPQRGDLMYTTSRDYGRTFATQMRVNSERGTAMATGNIRGGQMAMDGAGRVHVAWIGSSLALPRSASNSAPVLYTRLNDLGDAFEPTQHVNQASWGADGATVAADNTGHVFVFWHAQPPQGKDEADRRLWIAKSADSGKSFVPEAIAFTEPTGVCGCCGTRAFVGADDTVYVLFRSATNVVHRDMYLLSSVDHSGFRGSDIAGWDIGACVMSSEFFLQSGKDILAAWESEKQVYFGRIKPGTTDLDIVIAAPGLGRNRKYPALATNKNGQILFVWTDNMAWGKGGTVEWQLYDRNLQPEAGSGKSDDVPVWSLVAAFARPDGGFVVMF